MSVRVTKSSVSRNCVTGVGGGKYSFPELGSQKDICKTLKEPVFMFVSFEQAGM